MMKNYSQITAMLSITKASLRAIFRSPSAVIFSFVFPFIFILVFGFIGNSGGRTTFKIVVDKNSDTLNDLYKALINTEGVRVMKYASDAEMNKDLNKGRIAGILRISKNSNASPPYTVSLQSTTSSNDKWPQLKSLIESRINEVSNRAYTNRPAYAEFNFDYKKDIAEVRQYKTIDFILPGQLGFSLLSAGVFGVAFLFFNLRQQLVLKRFFATPITRPYIVLGEAISRVFFEYWHL